MKKKKIRIEVKPFDANWNGVTESYISFKIKTSNQAKKKGEKHKWLQIIVIIRRNVCEAYTKQQNLIIFSSKTFLIVPDSTQPSTMHSNIYKHTFFSALYNFFTVHINQTCYQNTQQRVQSLASWPLDCYKTTIFNITSNINITRVDECMHELINEKNKLLHTLGLGSRR